MSYLSFDEFCAAAKSSPLQAVKPDGIHIDGKRFNDRKLQRHLGGKVRVRVEEHPLGLTIAVCFTEDGIYVCNASEKHRPHHNVFGTFTKALDLCPRAMRRLHHFEPWHGEPWWRHLADVYWSVFTEPPMLALPWNGGAK